MNIEACSPTDAPPLSLADPVANLRRIVLTGFMGAGKSTVGRLLAARIGWDFLDLDAYLETRAGMSIPSIFAIHGEAHFRQVESSALAAALGHQHVVLALGGGAPEVLTNRLMLEQTPATTTIFLDAPFPALYDRCMMQALNPATPEASRPLLADPATAEARFLTRHPIYRRLARVTVATTDLSPEDTVSALLCGLSAAPTRKGAHHQ